ncbi:sterol desaturase/sphingolipid hydroxylase (fatty acid hydroxylase superfamily) [Runella defluvii]|uniref:Sterol desaturase/sphingolipid hydroxylase (Fatty acid hydroxylase superfamily) n=1 Tax=Runella defluvii TaxID=370973 RepID=A0A7W5ZGQ4_9BACT|nr:sterol desaturase family protein [Runella defluvii]MBB3836483.1 sterol desaturase/sphingolipid hydroxylase (fatty acid hydroxylase superfamily) [Runella defluvii]
METIDFAQPDIFAQTAFYMFLGIFGRYVLIAALFYYLFKVKYQAYFQPREVNLRPRRPEQHWREIGFSFITSVIFAVVGTAMVVLWQKGYTKIYTDFSQYSILWFVFSIGLVLFLHETYYYWLHRWMHLPKVYKWVHKAHHDSITTSAWTSFSFHPTESILQALVLPALTFVIPLHYSAIVVILLIMTTTSVINHLNTELYPRDFHRHWFGKWWIGATHHSLHHSQFKYNYGLYFTFWDKWGKTESPDYDKLFDKKTSQVGESA